LDQKISFGFKVGPVKFNFSKTVKQVLNGVSGVMKKAIGQAEKLVDKLLEPILNQIPLPSFPSIPGLAELVSFPTLNLPFNLPDPW
jgi:hypothetical protein